MSMIRFKVYENGSPARSLNLEGAHLLGGDRIPIRSEMKFSGGELTCEPRTRGAAALAIMWPVRGIGHVLLETPRLLERQEPYNLLVELARGQLMRIAQKREDWGMYDLPEGQPLYDEAEKARDQLVAAITSADDVAASRHADGALAMSLAIGEKLGLFGAEFARNQKRTDDDRQPASLGCCVSPEEVSEENISRLQETCDFAGLSFNWADLQPQEGKYQTAAIERALKILHAKKVPIWGTGLLAMDEAHLPPWMIKASRDYETFRDLIIKHLRTILRSFEGHVQSWEVATGLHMPAAAKLTLEQIMELTRAACVLAKQASPKSQVIVGIVLPWGEYYATDPASLPPRLYAEMVMEQGVHLDGLGLRLQFGGQQVAQYVRDMMQVSSILDSFGAFGKPLHVTCAGVPSKGLTPLSGYWHDEWSEPVQAEWLKEFYSIALAKPFVASIAWQALSDGDKASPWGGLLRKDGAPKQSFQELVALRKELVTAQS